MNLPQNWEYVFAAYGIFAFALAGYVFRLVRRGRAVSRALSRLDSAKEHPPGG
jgi:heme exporter protein CcmD